MSEAEERFFVHTLSKRLEKLEAAAFDKPPRTVRRFLVEGPADLPVESVVSFLRDCGHDLRDDHLNVVRRVISATPAEPLPLRDLTPCPVDRR